MVLRDWIHVIEDFTDLTIRYVVTPSDLKYGVDIFKYDQKIMRKHVNLGI